MSSTIYATSSGAPPAAIAIIRVSGPRAFVVAEGLVGALPAPRYAALRALHDPRDHSLLDRALVLVFPAPHTATGEDLVEFHVHGGRAVVAAVEAAIGAFSDTRRAEPGEFTRRALENGVIDLTAAEGLGDLLAAQTETQRRAALRMAEGGIRVLIEGWTDRLIAMAANVESQLDFSDADDVVPDEMAPIHTRILAVTCEIATMLTTPSVERLHDGIRVVIAGPPNAGKSTLLNALTGRDVAIVSAISGTTRDRIEAPIVRNNVVYILTDTAGLTENPGDDIEAIGIDRAKAAMAAADIVVWLGDQPPSNSAYLAVHARSDSPSRHTPPPFTSISVSGVTGSGLEALWNAIAARAVSLLPTEDSQAVNARQRNLLDRCRDHLVSAMATDDALIVAEELRLALKCLDGIVGRANAETVLDSIFSNFCIGK